MQVVSLVGTKVDETFSLVAQLSGQHIESSPGQDFFVTTASTSQHSFTLLGLTDNEQSPSFSSIPALLFADTLVLVLSEEHGITHQHQTMVLLAASVGITTCIIAIDDATPNISRAEKIAKLLGRYSFTQRVVVNIDSTRNELDPLLDALDRADALSNERDQHQPGRLWIQRTYQKQGVGTIVAGFLSNGALAVGDQLRTSDAHRYTVAALQQLEGRANSAESGSYIALNLGAVDPKHLQINRVLMTNDVELRNCVDADVAALSATGLGVNDLVIAAIGSEWCFASLRQTSASMIHERGTIQLQLSRSLPVLSGDRVALFSVSSHVLVGAGIVTGTSLSLLTEAIDPRRASARGWLEVDEYEKLTGTKTSPTIGRWVVDLATLEEAFSRLRSLVAAAGSAGLDLSSLSEKEQALLRGLAGIEISNGRVFISGVKVDFAIQPMQVKTLQL